MQLRQYLRIVTKRWWLIALLVVAATGSAVYIVSQRLPVYRSSVTLQLSPAPERNAFVFSVPERSKELALTYSIFLKTHTFADLVVKREGLAMTPEALIEAISARLIEDTPFFEITAVGASPENAQRLATIIANNFITENLTQQQQQQQARRSAGMDTMQLLLREKLERERQNYEALVTEFRQRIEQAQTQPPSTNRDQLIESMQTQLSGYEERLLKVMGDQVNLLPANGDSAIDTASIVEPAALPVRPINSSSNLQTVLFALLASLIAGIALAFGLEFLDYTVKGPEDLEEIFGKPVLGVFNRWQGGDAKQAEEGIVTLKEGNSALAEGFRVLRTNLYFTSVDRPLHSLVITSAGPGEGKTFVASNLAVAIAQTGKRVILVDADLRRPNVHRRFGLARMPGLGDLIIANGAAGPTGFQGYLQDGPVPGLRVLTCGIGMPNPAELLTFEHTAKIFEALEADADLVIYDTPPVLTVTDAAILAGRADAVLQVVKAGTTRRDLVLKTRDILQRVGGKVVGPALNMVHEHEIGYYYQYYYYHKYGYDEDGQARRKGGRGGNGRGRKAEAPPLTQGQA